MSESSRQNWLDLPEHPVPDPTEAQGERPAPALAGYKVVDFSHFLAGPFATMLWGDLGAEVIKIESPGRGDEFRHYGPHLPELEGQGAPFLWGNRNKRSIALNLKVEAAREAVDALIRRADVLVENFSTGVLDRLGFGYERCRQLNPRLVYCSIAAYGRDGDFADRFGFDSIIQAESGLMSMNGFADREGVRTLSPIVDISTAMMASNAVLAALLARERTGVGQRVEVSLYGTGLVMTGFAAMQRLVSGIDPQRQGNTSPDSSPSGVFQASDRPFLLSCSSTRLFKRLCTTVLGDPALADDPAYREQRDRIANRQSLNDRLQQAFARKPWSHWSALMREAGVPCGEVRTVGQALASGETRDRGMLTQIDHPTVGSIPNLGLPFRLDATPVVPPRPAPALGADTETVLTEILHYQPADLQRLRTAGAFDPS